MKKQILIVDDEDDCAELLRYHLHKENYETVIARNGREALEAVRTHTPDAVLLDIMMPELNGWEVCRILREGAHGKSLPIIMLTALSDEDERVKGLGLGADDYLAKPYSMKELLLKIRNHIDRQQMITRLETREQEQETTMRYMVHELRNSLTVIGGFSSPVLQKDDTNMFLKRIHTAALHADNLLKDSSLLSRLETGGAGLSIEPIAIGSLVNETVELLQDAAKKSNCAITVANGAVPTVLGNGTAIRQIMINLITNAIKYSTVNKEVLISLKNGNNCVEIAVQDEGSGIAPCEINRIFDKFYRIPGSERVKGAGLGLYIVKRLTEAMGGSVGVVSRPGIGSTFTVSFVTAGNAALCALR